MDWLDQYLDGMGNYKTTVSPADTHIWGVKPKLNNVQQRMIFDATAQSELEYRQLVKEARSDLEEHGMSQQDVAEGVGADPGSAIVGTNLSYAVDGNDVTVELPGNASQFEFTVSTSTSSFNIILAGYGSLSILNYYDANNFENCYLSAYNLNNMAITFNPVYVTATETLISNGQNFTIYYSNTGSALFTISKSEIVEPVPTATPTATPTPTPSPTGTPTTTPTPTPSPTQMPSPTQTPSSSSAVALPNNPAGPVVFVSNKLAQNTDGPYWFMMHTSTNFGRTYWWDGTFTDTSMSGPYTYWQDPQKTAVGGIVRLSAFSTNSTGTISGYINQLVPTYGNFLSIDYSGCSQMTSVSIGNNNLRALSSLNLTGCRNLSRFELTGQNALRVLNMTGVSALETLTLQNTMLSSVVVPADSVRYLTMIYNSQLRTVTLQGLHNFAQINIAYSPLLRNFDLSTTSPYAASIYSCALSAITFGSAISAANLAILDVHSNNLSAIDLSNLNNLNYLSLYNNQLTSINLPVGFTSSAGRIGSIDVSNNKLNAAALNNFFTNLGTYAGDRDVYGVGGTIQYGGNPGTATCNPSIASAKGWQPRDQ